MVQMVEDLEWISSSGDCNVESQQNHIEKTSPVNTSNVPKNQQESWHLPNLGGLNVGPGYQTKRYW